MVVKSPKIMWIEIHIASLRWSGFAFLSRNSIPLIAIHFFRFTRIESQI
jgi:hypothetical protein